MVAADATTASAIMGVSLQHEAMLRDYRSVSSGRQLVAHSRPSREAMGC